MFHELFSLRADPDTLVFLLTTTLSFLFALFTLIVPGGLT